MQVRAAAVFWLILAGTACRGAGLTDVSGLLQFSTPDDPAALSEPDAGLVIIDFGQVTIDSTMTLTVDLSSLIGQVTLGSVTAVQPDPEFTLPLVPGAIVGAAQTAVMLSFAPSSLGTKNAIFALTDYSPSAATVLINLTGQGIADGLNVSPNPLDFGRVELNQPQPASLTITNRGSLPATLTLSAFQGANAALFTLGVPVASVLAPGASTTLTATFAPLTAETATASFTIDGWSTTDPIAVGLIGTGVQTWLEVTPLLNFNYVQINHVFVKPAVLTNRSSYATLHLVGPPPAVTGAEFSLQSFAPTPIAPGQSLSIPVAFSPYGSGPASGSLTLSTDDPLAQHPVVPLEGYGGGPEIYCTPRLGFEPTLVGAAQTLQAICVNAGTDVPGHPEISLQILQSGVTTDNGAFTASLTLPDGGLAGPDGGVSLSAGQATAVDVTFVPRDAGVFAGRLTVASNDLNDADAGTILSGDEPCSVQVDTFTFPAPPKKVDLAWILDNDDDATSIATLGTIVPQLIHALNQSGIDYQIAVTSTDTCEVDGSDQGSFEPCDHCLSTAPSSPIFVTPATWPDPATALGELFGLFALPARAQCEALIGDEHLFDAVADAFSPTILLGHNSGFIRPDAYLAILMANGDSEDDAANVTGEPLDYLTSLPEAISIVESLKPDPGQVSFSYIYQGDKSGGAANLPLNVGELVQATGGLAINGAGPNWEAQLIDLFSYGAEGQSFFALRSMPSDPQNIEVKVNGVLTTNWSLIGNRLYLTGTPLPAPGSIVTVTYQVGC